MKDLHQIISLCLDFGWSPNNPDLFKLAWDLLKLMRLEEDIIVNYLNELI